MMILMSEGSRSRDSGSGYDDALFMERALMLAKRACEMDEVPIGCVIAKHGEIIGEGSNLKETDCDPTAHAEIVAIRDAARRYGTWHLDDATLYVTCEPCPMCAGAIVNARIPLLVYGCDDPKGGGIVSHYGIGVDGALNHTIVVTGGVLAEAGAQLLKEYFEKKRQT
jgi:tRNA(adenine34) deaminase